MKRLLLIATLTVGLIVAGAVVQQASAQDAPTAGQALEIAPPVVNLRADPGETITTQINIRGVSASSLRVTSQVNDFGAGDREDGSPVVQGLNEDEDYEPSPYSIINWVQPLPEMTLAPREIQNLPVTIDVPDNAAPGGYYGVIRFTAIPADMDQSGVSLSASLGALVFIRVAGDANESMEIVEFAASKNGQSGWLFNSQPVDLLLRIKNTGTVHEQPVGRAAIKDLFGNDITTLNINLERRNVLPDSVRQFSTSLDKSAIGDRWLFGRYTADLTVAYGENGEQTVTDKIAFWIIPWKLILGIIVLLVLLVLAFRFWLHRHDRAVSSRRYRR